MAIDSSPQSARDDAMKTDSRVWPSTLVNSGDMRAPVFASFSGCNPGSLSAIIHVVRPTVNTPT